MRNRIGIFLLISFAVALLLVWLFYPTEEEQILAQFEELSEIASKPEAASTIVDALVLDDFRSLFAPKVLLKTGRSRLAGEYTNQELMQLYGRIRLQAKRLSLRFERIEFVSLNDADATVTADVHAEGAAKQGKNRAESFRAEVRLNKLDGDWLFHQFVYLDSFAND
jgi:hypothetical protein